MIASCFRLRFVGVQYVIETLTVPRVQPMGQRFNRLQQVFAQKTSVLVRLGS
jgi:hypothetical protein